MQISNRFVTDCNIRIVIQIFKLSNPKFEVLLESYIRKLEKLESSGKKSSEICFLDILTTTNHFYHYFCLIFISKCI